MSKPFLMISCPLDTFSGYGARSRDIVKALLKLDKYDVKILSQRWGACPFGALDRNNPEDKKLLQRIVPNTNQLPRQPDIWIQITVPNEFQAVGKFNIGITAGIETTICDPSWIEGLNRMNLNLVSSNHAKAVFQNSKFEKRDNATQQLLGMVELQKPVEVLFEGVNLEKYFKIDAPQSYNELVKSLNEIPEDFCFLFMGHWLQGTLGEDRKNVGMTIKVFLETFKNKKIQPALILKTSGAGSSIVDKDQILKRIDEVRQTVKGALPNIYLLHGELSDSDINSLYNHPKVKSMISLTKGEGFGRPLLEFSLMQKPLVVSGWSGHTDFLTAEFTLMVKGEIKQIHPSAVIPNMLIQESGWFTPDYPIAGLYIKEVFENYDKHLEKAKRQAYRSKTWFSFEEMVKKLDETLTAYLPEFPKQVELKLPQIKKISLPKKLEEVK
jgi:glycosyltransferase involved in cell wall biosynthesis